MGSAPLKERTFYDCSQVLASRVQSRPRRSTNNEEVSKVKTMCRAGDVTKPECVRFCNQIPLFDLQASKEDKNREEARKAKQDLMMDFVGSKTTNRVQGKPKQQKRQQAWSQQAPPRKPTVAGHELVGYSDRKKRRQCDGRIIPGETRIRKHHNKWQRLRRNRWDYLLNNKRDTESTAEGAAELHPTTQRLIPAPRKRKGKRNLWVINLGT